MPSPTLLVALWAFAGLTAGPAPRRIAIAPTSVDGDLAPNAVREIETRIDAAMERAGFDVVRDVDVLGDTPCESAPCVLKATKATEASHLMQVWIAQEGRDYAVKTVVWSGRDGSEVATVKQNCEICGLNELTSLIADQSGSLKEKLESLPATLIVETQPSGAVVRVGGRVVGVSPIVETLPPGTYTVEVQKAGFRPRQREVNLVEAAEESVELGLQAVEPTVHAGPADEPAPRRPLRTAGWALLGVGIAATAAGVPLLILDERPVRSRCTGENVGEGGVCKFRHNTLVPGAVLTAVGGAVLITSIALLVVDAKRNKGAKSKKTAARVRPTPGGLRVRF